MQNIFDLSNDGKGANWVSFKHGHEPRKGKEVFHQLAYPYR